MWERENLSSDAVWEDEVGYSRAVRVGPMVFVSGTTAADPAGGAPIGGESPREQGREALRRIESSLGLLDARLDQVVRTRIYVTDIANWPEIAQAHHEFFGSIKPAATMVEVRSLISPDLLVEIEADAVVPQ
jgi:enamine deaminase RidA (YjgF/YER057c/UK114 family)